ncbi:hypothetical protein [Hymenobacter crusticola]|uniref:xylose isomerase n=1 Tax=Hymenobacter crusticola TaxID=1770526 RepID=A0A243WEY4_9BACT|nr:hypothetical protein [Hymenobacter crusticola]OUJ74029.1 hypothetical protein BXP70_09760 [Hymenobacter crusticola]
MAHIDGMDTFVRTLVAANDILKKAPYKQFRQQHYASFDSGQGKAFEDGQLTLEDLGIYALSNGESEQKSDKQKQLEGTINQYI